MSAAPPSSRHPNSADGAAARRTNPGGSTAPMVERTSEPQATGAEAGDAAEDPGRPAKAGAKAQFDKKTIALVYDFDGTLSPRPCRSTPSCPRSARTPKAFWAEANRAREGARRRPPHHLHASAVQEGQGEGRPHRPRRPRAPGRNVELFAGVEDWFDAIGDYVKLRAESHGVSLRHYLISSGLTEIIEGTPIYKRFHNVFASRILVRRLRRALSPSASSPTPARRSTCSASTRASRTSARTSTSTCRRRRGPSHSPT